MIPPVSAERYEGQYDTLEQLADFLLRSRAGRYVELIASGHLSADDAFRDEMSRAAIAADWRAIAADNDRDDTPEVFPGWKIWCLEESLRIAKLHLTRLDPNAEDFADHVDLRDAIACLLAYQRRERGPLFYQKLNREIRADLCGGRWKKVDGTFVRNDDADGAAP